MKDDERLMRLAVEAARRGRPSPNPHVGAVVATAAGEVLGVGHHERAGAAHAEVAAIQAAGETRGHTLFVTMEPCNHHGRTPPCTDAILTAGLARVVIGARDPAPHVPGAVDKLRAAGLQVDVGVLEDECRELIADFTKHIQTGLPWVVLKAAVTLDGRMATRTGDSKWITGPEARRRAHLMRDRCDAVLVGVGTVLADDPELTVRHVEGVDPLRVVLDTHLRTPADAKLARPGTVIAHGPEAPAERRAALEARGVELLPIEAAPRVDLPAVLRALGARDVVRLLVEGGPAVHAALLGADLADEAAVFVAPKIVGDAQAKSLAAGRGADTIATAWELRSPRIEACGPDVLIRGLLSRGSG